MKITATLKNLRIAPRKVRLVTDSIVQMDSEAALVHLKHLTKRSGTPVEKLLQSALANAENNFGLDKSNMYISSILVGEGPRLKRWLPRAQGRATLILKRTTNIVMELDERVEGKNRKTKEQMVKERKQREAARAKREKEDAAKTEKEEKDATAADNKEKSSKKPDILKKETVNMNQENGFLKKVFQRKSV